MLKPEHSLIAFTTAELPPGPWLVFAPHADDETFGMGGSLVKAHQAAIETHVIVVTDGALGGESSNLVETRRQEAQAATEILGVSSLQFWSEPDRELIPGDSLVANARQAIVSSKAASVFFPGPLELHPDHRATAQLVWQALQSMRGVNPIPQIYAYEIGVQNPANRLIDISAQRITKDRAMSLYASQNSQNSYPELVTALNKARTFTLPETVECAEGFYQFETGELDKTLREVSHAILDLYF